MQSPDSSSGGYESRGVLARGGMGLVELAVREQGAFQRLYALKRLLPDHRGDERYRAMFLDEARVAGMIRHANVISVLDVGEDERGPFLVMDFIEGITVSQLIRWASERDEPLSVQLAARIVRQAAAGIEAAHNLRDDEGESLNLIHRDVSPQNIMIGFDGVVRVTDFGIAKSIGRISKSTTNVLKGKAGYMAPEQLRFEHATQATDFFGLGVVFFELLSGERLYAGEDSVAVAQRILTEAPPDIFELREDVHPGICELLFSLLAKTQDARPASAGDIVTRLDMVIDELSADDGIERIDRFLAANFADIAEEKAALRRRATSPVSGEWLAGESHHEADQRSAEADDRTHIQSKPPAMDAMENAGAENTPLVRGAPSQGGAQTQKVLWALIAALVIALVAVIASREDRNDEEVLSNTAPPAVAADDRIVDPAASASDDGSRAEENSESEANAAGESAASDAEATGETMSTRRARRRGMRRRPRQRNSRATEMDEGTTAAARAVKAF